MITLEQAGQIGLIVVLDSPYPGAEKQLGQVVKFYRPLLTDIEWVTVRLRSGRLIAVNLTALDVWDGLIDPHEFRRPIPLRQARQILAEPLLPGDVLRIAMWPELAGCFNL